MRWKRTEAIKISFNKELERIKDYNKENEEDLPIEDLPPKRFYYLDYETDEYQRNLGDKSYQKIYYKFIDNGLLIKLVEPRSKYKDKKMLFYPNNMINEIIFEEAKGYKELFSRKSKKLITKK